MSKFYNQTFEFVVTLEEQGLRLDKLLAYKLTEFSRTKIKKLIESDNFYLNDCTFSNISYSVREGDELRIFVPPCEKSLLTPKNLDLNIIYEDNELIILNKPPYLTVHPGAGNHNDTLVNALIHHFGNNLSQLGGAQRPGIIHRLDKDTSGLIVIAKDDITHAKLSKQLAEREIKRTYLALVYGTLTPHIGTIQTNIARNPKDRKKMTVVKGEGRVAITRYNVLEKFGGDAISLIECELETGRTHQIRVHLTHKKTPIIGDQTYGTNLNHNLNCFNKETAELIKQFPRQALHAVRLKLTHPSGGQELSFESNLPEDITQLLAGLRS
ncbi:pseudouridylate synthase, 23S RNA-specific [endosymbiont of Acanthamoeba sp. UWC8]|uniref:RluA family pseudouridine synthase n=1 Tax=endosymbiont of Acanthamoeba sp. UWC8 TaxID=86106 RepID=UPI0004D1CAF0|nr:RluA family pseudouridine synthase [endosymbiont of Acanthamoeba sp. UWC8]AIF81100.1 pseudouridylate synthase, 23S RNA-specific [endosymbiont of Acanthamoeba sp. UWC8]